MDMYNQSKQYLANLRISNIRFSNFIKSKKNIPSIEYLLSLPFVHVPKLERVFRELLSVTPVNDTEFQILSYIYYKIKPISIFLVNCADNNTHTAELIEISERLTPQLDLIEPGRSFVFIKFIL